jgi:leucyl/phenylalanyl-tRNA--protein transferase
MFFGESMFSRRTDGSKVALVVLAAQLSKWGFPMIDCQMQTTHLATMGAREIPRRTFVAKLTELVAQPPVEAPWGVDDEVIAQFR